MPDTLAELLRKGTPEGSHHHKESDRILRTLAKHCHWTALADITTESFTAFLQELHQQGRAARTQNRYHEVLRAFLNWSITQGWITESPIAGMKMLRQTGKARKHRRRAYTIEEWHRLIQAAPEPRRTVYLVASFSGLRRSELRRLQKTDCTPIGNNPTWHARPEVTKNGQAINLPMLPDCARALAPVWNTRPQPSGSVIRSVRLLVDKYGRSSVPHIVTLHEDLAAAGIPRQDDQGRWADVHSFRYFFCTQLARILPMREVQVLMRHSTITLTMNLYNDLGIKDVADHVQTLPSLFPGVTDQITDQATNVEVRRQT